MEYDWKHRFRHILDEMAEESPAQDDGNIAFADDVSEIDSRLHRMEQAGLSAAKYSQRFFGTPQYDPSHLVDLINRDIAAYFYEVLERMISDEEGGYVVDVCAAVLGQQVPLARRQMDPQAQLRKAVRAFHDLWDCADDEFQSNRNRIEAFLVEAHELLRDENDFDEAAATMQIVANLDYLNLIAAKVIGDPEFTETCAAYLRSNIMLYEVNAMHHFGNENRFRLPLESYEFLTESLLSLQRRAGVFDPKKRLLLLSTEEFVTRRQEYAEELVYGDWFYQVALLEFGRALLDKFGNRKKHLAHVQSYIDRCSHLPEERRERIKTNLKDSLKLGKKARGDYMTFAEQRNPSTAPHSYQTPKQFNLLQVKNYKRRRT